MREGNMFTAKQFRFVAYSILMGLMQVSCIQYKRGSDRIRHIAATQNPIGATRELSSTQSPVPGTSDPTTVPATQTNPDGSLKIVADSKEDIAAGQDWYQKCTFCHYPSSPKVFVKFDASIIPLLDKVDTLDANHLESKGAFIAPDREILERAIKRGDQNPE